MKEIVDFIAAGTTPADRVNSGGTFLAFGKNGGGGFARDLMIDCARMHYWQGHISPLRPADFGLESLDGSENLRVVFDEIVGWHRERIIEVMTLTEVALARLQGG